MKIKFALLFLPLIIILLGCNKEKRVPIEYTTHYVDSTLLAEYLFNSGSFWIYEDQTTNSDSVFVIGVEHDVIDIPCPHGCPGGKVDRYEYYNMVMNSFYQTGTFNLYFMFGSVRLNGGGEYGQNGQPVLSYYANIGDEFNGATVAAKYDSLLVLDKYYYNVTKMSISVENQYQQEFEYDTDLYFAPDIGLIKNEVYDTVSGVKTWNLVRYHIENKYKKSNYNV